MKGCFGSGKQEGRKGRGFPDFLFSRLELWGVVSNLESRKAGRGEGFLVSCFPDWIHELFRIWKAGRQEGERVS